MPTDPSTRARLPHWLAAIIRPLIAVVIGLAAGMIIIGLSGGSPLFAIGELLKAGFTCGTTGACAFLTTLQYATPLALLGLSAALSLRAGIFSLGQYGCMLLGAAMATSVASSWQHPLLALLGAMLVGALWGVLPAALKLGLGVNEIISSIVLNAISGFGLIFFSLARLPEPARLVPLVPGTKLTAGIFIAFASAVLLQAYLFRGTRGYAARMSGQAPAFAQFAGIPVWRSVMGASLIAGAVAGLAGAIEILGVHYHFVQDFTENIFDGVIVALLGQLHPLGVLLAAIFLGGLRLGSLTGLLLGAAVPRELGSIMVGIMVLAMSARVFWHRQRP